MHRESSGFTIVELLVVIVVIGILAAITIVSYTGISQRATVASLQSDLTSSSNILKMYYAEYGNYPTLMDGNNCPVGPTDTKYCLKPTTNNTFAYSSSSTSTFILTDTNVSTVCYTLTDSTSPTVGCGPTQLFSDDFNRADGAIGSNWTVIGGAYAISGSKLSSTYSGSNYFAMARATSAGSSLSNVTVSAKFGTGSFTWAGVFARFNGTSGYTVEIRNNGSDIKITKFTNSPAFSDVLLNINGYTFTTGDMIGIRCVNNVISALKNGSVIGSVINNDIAYGYVGIGRSIASNLYWDDFTVENAP